MSTNPASGQTPSAPSDQRPATQSGPMAWWHTLDRGGKRAFAGAFMGYGLDSYDYWVLPLGLAAITATFGLSSGEAGLLATTTLVASAAGGVLSGVLADRIGRVKTLMITVIVYAIFTAACGLASSYEMLLVFRALQGLGFGGEWAAGAILIGEYARPEHRGRAVAVVQSAWSVGWGLAVIAYTAAFSFLSDETAWRVLFLTGALPALMVVYIRRSVKDAPLFEEKRDEVSDTSLIDIFRSDLLKTTLFASLLATGVQGGYYTLATWVPTYLSEDRGLDVIGSGGYLTFLITGAFAGYLTGGVFTDWLGRKNTFRLFAVLSAVLMILYTRLPADAGTLVMVLGFPLGFCSSAIFAGFGSYLTELFPIRARGAGQGFCYNVGRAIGAAFPALIGFLAETRGVGAAMAFGTLAYALAVVALFGLPETKNRELT